MPIQTRYFSFDDVTAEQGWHLLEYCREIGGSEFTVTALVSPTESERMKEFFAQLDRYALKEASRRHLSAPVGSPMTRNTPLWELTSTAIDIVRTALPTGIASREYDTDLWLEDLTVYRDGEFLMGVLSHENGGVLRFTELELRGMRRRIGAFDRESVAWVGF